MKTDGVGEPSGMPGQAALLARAARIAFLSSVTVKLCGLPFGSRIRTPSRVRPRTLYPPTERGALSAELDCFCHRNVVQQLLLARNGNDYDRLVATLQPGEAVVTLIPMDWPDVQRVY